MSAPRDPRPALRRAPRLEVTPLPDGRLRLRFQAAPPRGTVVLGGVAEKHLGRLLDLVDGRRTLADLQRELAAEFEAEGVRDVVETLLRCGALEKVPEPASGGGSGGAATGAGRPAAGAVPPEPGPGGGPAPAGEAQPPGEATREGSDDDARRIIQGPTARRSPTPRSAAGRSAAAGLDDPHPAPHPVEHHERRPSRAVHASPVRGRPVRVGILGGGTAGYLAALALRVRRPDVEVTLVESSTVPVIGVGEATTPLLPQFLHADLGLDVHDLWRHVRPTFKLGIRFDWGRPAGEGPAAFNYPFGPLRLLEPAFHDGDVEAASLRSLLMTAGRVPLYRRGSAASREGRGPASEPGDGGRGAAGATPGGAASAGAAPPSPAPAGGGGSAPPPVREDGRRDGAHPAGRVIECDFGTAVAYHLDNAPFVAWLRRQAAERGVEPVDARIAEVRTVGEGDGRRVDELVADDGRRFRADLWLDCSGFRSLLLGEALGSDWVPFTASLFDDRAVLFRTPLPEGGAAPALPPYTTAATWDAGWCWTLPQRGELHHGYVYSSAFLSDEEARAEVERRWAAAGSRPVGEAGPGPGAGGGGAGRGAGPEIGRALSFPSGRRRHFVRGNVAGLGNAYGFVEPLESTALHLLVRQIGLLLRLLPWTPGEAAGRLALANRRVAGWWDYLRWFLALHFRFNRRLDTPYWRACREDTDLSAHAGLLEAFRHRGPLSADPSLASLFDAPDPLWGMEGIDLLLLAQGVPCPLPTPLTTTEEHHAWRTAAHRRTATALPQSEALALLDRHPALRQALAAPFLQTGPAF